MWRAQHQFGIRPDNVIYTDPEDLQDRGRNRNIHPLETQRNRAQNELSNRAGEKPYWLQARELMKQWQSELELAIANIPVEKAPIDHIGKYISALEEAENVKIEQLNQNKQPSSLAEVARMRAKFSYYERIWIKLVYDAETKENPKNRTKFLHFEDVPWPMFGYPGKEEMLSQERQEILDFILHPDRIGPEKPHSEALEEARKFWDCDAIYDRLMSRVVPQDVQLVFIAYRRVWKAIGGLDNMGDKRMAPNFLARMKAGLNLYDSGY